MSIVGTTMKAEVAPRSRRGLVVAALALALAGALGCGTALADGFSYHGQLEQAGEPANGNYDLKLTLYSAEQGGQVLGGPLEISGVTVTEGVFSTDADFGPLANLDDAWLGVEVKAEGGRYEALAGRSKAAAAGEACWALDGNTGNPAGSYLGTADANDVWIKSGGLNAARFFQNGGVSFFPWTSTSGVGATSVSYSNGAVGNYSFAGGYYGKANYEHSFVWNAEDSAVRQFVIGAPGGVGINITPTAPVPNYHVAELSIKSNATGNAGNKDISMIRLVSGTDKAANLTVDKDGQVSLYPAELAGNTSIGRGGGSGTIYFANNAGVRRIPSANAFEVQGNASKSTAGSWLANSDGRIKQDIQPINNATFSRSIMRSISWPGSSQSPSVIPTAIAPTTTASPTSAITT